MKWFPGILVSAAIVFFSFPPFPLGYLMFFALVPVFLAIETAPNWKQAFLRMWVFVFLTNSAICFWVAHTMQHFAKVPAALSYSSVALLSVFEQSAWPIMAALRFALHKKLNVRPLFWTPACLMVLDFAWPKFFPNTVGYVFHSIPWLSQLADVTGVWGLSALIIVTNEMIAMAILRTWPKEELKKHLAASLGVVVIAFAYAGWRYHQVQSWMKEPTGSMSIAMIQPNINPVAIVREAKDKHQAREDLAQPLFEMSREALKSKPDLLFWPETAIANSFHSEDDRETFTLTKKIDQFFEEIKTPLLFGARDKKAGHLFNTLYFLTEQNGQTDIQRYNKHILLWLGEYVPFSRQFPALATALAKQGGTVFMSGEGPRLFNHAKAKLGPMICLEGLYPSYVRDIALKGADILVNATNDAWFGPGMEPALHLHLTAFRAIETRRPIVRATTTGYSAVMDIDGSLKVRTNLDEKVTTIANVPIYPHHTTPYLAWGSLLIFIAFLWTLFPLVSLRAKRSNLTSR